MYSTGTSGVPTIRVVCLLCRYYPHTLLWGPSPQDPSSLFWFRSRTPRIPSFVPEEEVGRA